MGKKGTGSLQSLTLGRIARNHIPAVLVFIGILIMGLMLARHARVPDPATSQRRTDELIGLRDPAHSVGQTFTAGKNHLSAIRLSLHTDLSGEQTTGVYSITLRLIELRNHTEVAKSVHRIPLQSQNFELEFAFTPQRNSKDNRYLLAIETAAPSDQVSLWSSSYNSYPSGELLLDGIPGNADITFWTYTTPPLWPPVLHLTANFANRFIDMLLFTLIILGMGYPIVGLFGGRMTDPLEKTILALVVGLAIPQILLFLLGILSIESSNSILVGPPILYTTILVVHKLRQPGIITQVGTSRVQTAELISIALLTITAVMVRLSQIDPLVTPPWLDGLAHVTILEKINRLKIVPGDAIYHLGFHSDVYFLQRLTGRTIPETILVFGQWLSVVSGLTFHLFARRILQSPASALLATTLFWFWSPFPAYLVTWSRYPYLLGLTILPAACWIFLKWADEYRTFNYTTASILLSGLALSHYGSLLIWFSFTFTLLICLRFLDAQESGRILKGIPFLILPVVLMIGMKLFMVFSRGNWNLILEQGHLSPSLADNLYLINLLQGHGGQFMIILGLAGVLAAFFHEKRWLLIIVTWVLILAAMDIVQRDLAGVSISNTTNLLIFLLAPTTLLAGILFKHSFGGTNFEYLSPTFFILLTVMTLSGGYNLIGILNPSTVLFSQSDQQAMDWIVNNSSQEDVFMVNAMEWNGKLKPADGGGWIPHITGRPILLFDGRNIEQEDGLNQADYVYVGSGYGDLSPYMTAKNPRFLLVYEVDGIKIFKTNP